MEGDIDVVRLGSEEDEALSQQDESLSQQDESLSQRSAFWHMQAVFDKLRQCRVDDAAAVPEPIATTLRRPRDSQGTKSGARYDGRRPAWLGPEPGHGVVTVTRCAWSMPPAERDGMDLGDGVSCHDVLGVLPEACATQLRRRFRQLVKQHHPDRGGDEQAFVNLASAYREALRLRFDG
jgi:hypothetical protein